ncbi:hypothetical protein [Chachezhania antarctica]|uniref:hypothetical protein n=1 Tax=Chachezhania antarctica TaxID=2340860 RepID=UPI0013CE7847|nr:hypothetical protein [Chachezhania antarctica]
MKLIAATLALLLPALPAAAQETDYRVLRLAQEAVENGWEITDEADLWTAYAEANGIEASEEVIEAHLVETAKARWQAPSAVELNMAQEILRAANGFATFLFQQHYAYEVSSDKLVICGEVIAIGADGPKGPWSSYKVAFFDHGRRLSAQRAEIGEGAREECRLGIR